MSVTLLAIESSCDETGAAIIRDGKDCLANIVATQVKSHMRFGGVVPEIASRHHVEQITQIVDLAFEEAGLTWEEIDGIAVTKGPGLVGSLLIGITAAKTLAFAHDKPLIGVNHIAGHIYANQLVQAMDFPLLALVVSGGHTELVYMPEDAVFEKFGDTRDDAVGEAYDKVGRLLDLPYPGGKRMDELAQEGRDTYAYPRPMLDEDNFDFSFSGLKSAVINHLHNADQRGEKLVKEDVAASFQAAAVEVLVEKTCRALDEYPVKQLLVAGGVAANSGLRRELQAALADRHPEVTLYFPPLKYCGDNAAMIGAAAYSLYQKAAFADLSLDAVPGLDISDS
ncbi:tRNA (adenosine(37)-N6)-threonylcarbamoyltransferase complex transferase subunit TsaD [Aerococcus sanguinicola]|uniref:tRNA (adenosine(37)-N6)-threonylcarbamoyltransferase complex transferase subunit TsaD n=1 Tax=unclassified Aerococcus TaxID=2618060 RepID=UPI0008A47EB6|nr:MULTISPECIES: tRNA (adenosine(37)-N6)-threonylcarbamoyltransferase complex transferase subunit TsaD [unclassified Aerococcus]KAB0646220.1 tRNA (adenosine(37)-N6)-threonylcarbamoyltransferase complex transferase subunit TsaD [Aerococcus sanguinicola]MDK6234090.1 tRNA (adenosine(37)-N6)-threonylcarbamoyltransferase complex transferase subunit TsaD [Aerococcus sp. UMB10185]MDK6856272.1 tRNA (adenosine(37)-N6)-threonylcarbamoyltransferase complex transferase subunit TsaD [Aerococcus sp. UMB7533]